VERNTKKASENCFIERILGHIGVE